MPAPTSLQPGTYYHIYNRGNNGEDLFREERNYRYFLELYAYHIEPVAYTYAYCLLKNHFHVLIRVKTETEIQSQRLSTLKSPPGTHAANIRASQHFSNLFNAYSKAINKAYQRTGSLFQDRFGRLAVNHNAYFTRLVYYIHYNPQKHGFVSDFREWPFSSYQAILSNKSTHIRRAEVLAWFGGVEELVTSHSLNVSDQDLAPLIEDDFG
ncbi:MAG: hypothetical protein M1434_01035 [Chloroflexi bacterium]|nr:hypothetical protein [Chloroflexota bacterium]MCL5273316.1 hypothetical protein [Chloroflexota bacterium]